MENYFNTFDNIKLFYIKDIPSNPKGIVLIIHGIAEHSKRYDYVKNKFLAENYGVYRFDLRGHGKSEGKRGYVHSFKDFIKDVDAIVNLIKSEHENLPLYILGHSMGGFITACYGIAHGDKIDGEILSGAATGKVKLSLKLKSIRFPHILQGRVPNNLYNFISRNPKVIENYKKDKLVLKFTTARLNLQIANAGVKWIKNNIKKYKLPCLILHGQDDHIIPSSCSTDFYNNIGSIDKEIKIYKNLYHEILNEDYKDYILGDIFSWLNKRMIN
ncbi:MAG: lysophospholipase [Clostridium sp.]|nr:lysophospholipase [Clostridium sp.]